MPRPKKRKMGAAEHLIRLVKARRRLRAQRAINATQAEEHDKLKRQHSETSEVLDKSNQQLQLLLEQQQTRHLAVLTALEKNNQHAQEVSDPMKSAIDTIKHSEKDPAKNTAGRFSGFTKLPSELRTMIWEMALPGRRVYEPRLKECPNPWPFTAVFLQQTYPPPVIRGVCKEAWKVTEDHGLFCFGLLGSSHSGCWFNPSKDLVYISDSTWEQVCDITDHRLSYLLAIESSGAQHLAWASWYLHGFPDLIQDVVREAPWCETITAVVEAPTMEDDSDIKAIYPLHDRDSMTMCLANGYPRSSIWSWASQRNYILSSWNDFTILGEKVPKLEGLELVRTKQHSRMDHLD